MCARATERARDLAPHMLSCVERCLCATDSQLPCASPGAQELTPYREIIMTAARWGLTNIVPAFNILWKLTRIVIILHSSTPPYLLITWILMLNGNSITRATREKLLSILSLVSTWEILQGLDTCLLTVYGLSLHIMINKYIIPTTNTLILTGTLSLKHSLRTLPRSRAWLELSWNVLH